MHRELILILSDEHFINFIFIQFEATSMSSSFSSASSFQSMSLFAYRIASPKNLKSYYWRVYTAAWNSAPVSMCLTAPQFWYISLMAMIMRMMQLASSIHIVASHVILSSFICRCDNLDQTLSVSNFERLWRCQSFGQSVSYWNTNTLWIGNYNCYRVQSARRAIRMLNLISLYYYI